MNQPTRTELAALGEFGLIERLGRDVQQYHPETRKGIGDDAAVLDLGGDQLTVITTDMLLEGVHFDLSYAPLPHVGYKAVAVNVSDVAAMNAIPKQITVSIAVSNRFSVEALEALYAGIKSACAEYKVDLVGGDTTASRAGLVISVTAVGQVEKDKVVYRSGAKPSDILCVTGDLGAAYVGLQIMEREKQVYLANPDMQPQFEGKDYLLGRQLKPTARMDVIYELRELGVLPTAMMDVSDGLASEILHICKQSGVGATLFEDKLPIDGVTYTTAGEMQLDPTTCALNGGEDYELLFTIGQNQYEKLKNHPDVFFIGYVNEPAKGINLITKNENRVPVKAQGWAHF
ncbi:MAG: thiamine-phosphate kinase [Cytophagales bacterium]|nr:thiamine-phosphate kinase [Cytophagales bacterium]